MPGLSRRLMLQLSTLPLLAAAGGGAAQANGGDPLPSWNEGGARQRIIDFVTATTTEGSKDFVAAADRIAVFDNDGCLWCEQPLYFQALFILDRIRAMAPDHPEWKDQEPYRFILEGDLKSFAAQGEHGLLEAAMATHAGMTPDDFRTIVDDWLTTASHPKFARRFDSLIYQPMLELLTYLRAHGYETWIVSGGGVEFLRVFAETAYGIAPQQVIGSSIKTKYELKDGVPTILRLPELEFIDDKAGKPVAINRFIGRRPVFAAGNSDGDLEMLQWTTGGAGARFGLIVHHTDGDREYAYDRQSSVGRLDKALDEAPERGWLVVDMKADWKQIFPQ